MELIPRRFVKLNAAGTVEADLEAYRTAEDWQTRGADPAPGMVEVTDHPQWRGIGSLVGATRNKNGSFTLPA